MSDLGLHCLPMSIKRILGLYGTLFGLNSINWNRLGILFLSVHTVNVYLSYDITVISVIQCFDIM